MIQLALAIAVLSPVVVAFLVAVFLVLTKRENIANL